MRITWCVVLTSCVTACSAPRATEPAKRAEPLSVIEHYEGTKIVVRDDEAKAMRGDAVAVRKLLDAICHSDGGEAEYLCQYPFPKVLASQPQRVVEQAPRVCADIADRMTTCVHFSLSGLPAGAPVASSLKRLELATETEVRMRDVLVTALEHPDPDWP